MFEKYIKNARTDVYNLICYNDAYGKQQSSYFDNVRSGGVYVISLNSTTRALDWIVETFDCIDCWLKVFDKNQ